MSNKCQIQNSGTHQGALVQASGRAAGGWGVLNVTADWHDKVAIATAVYPECAAHQH